MAQVADHVCTAFIRSCGTQQLLSLSSDLIAEATRQIQHACGQPPASLCDALRWFSAHGKVVAVTSVAVQLHPSGIFITATCEFLTSSGEDQQRMVVEHVPLYLARSPALLHHIQQQCTAVQELVGLWDPNYGAIKRPEMGTLIKRLMEAADTKKVLSKISKKHRTAHRRNVAPQAQRSFHPVGPKSQTGLLAHYPGAASFLGIQPCLDAFDSK